MTMSPTFLQIHHQDHQVSRMKDHYELFSILRLGVRPTNGISIEFEIQPNFVVLWFKMCSTDHIEILHMSRQWSCREVCKISLWLVKYISN